MDAHHIHLVISLLSQRRSKKPDLPATVGLVQAGHDESTATPSNYIALCPCRQCECLADPGTHKCACLEHVDALFPSWPSPHQPQPRMDARPRKTRLGSTQPSHQPGGHLGHVGRLRRRTCQSPGSGFQTTQEIALRKSILRNAFFFLKCMHFLISTRV